MITVYHKNVTKILILFRINFNNNQITFILLLKIIINFIYDIIQNYFIPALLSIVERPINPHSFIPLPIYLLSQSSRMQTASFRHTRVVT